MKPHLRIPARRTQRRSHLSIALLACIIFLIESAHAQAPTPQEKPMKHYALFFYPTRSLTPEEQSRRSNEIPAWVKRVTDMGITLDPRSIGDTAATFSATGDETIAPNGSAITPALTNIVFFDAPSKEQAIDIARLHPGLHYGVIVDVREWTVPRPAAIAAAR